MDYVARCVDWLKKMARKHLQEFEVERHALTGLVIYDVMSEDLDQIEAEALTVGEDFSFMLAAFSIAVSFTVAVASVTIPPGKTHDVFWVVMLVAYTMGLFFGIKWFRSRYHVRSVIKKIRERGGSLGEEGKQVEVTHTATSPTTIHETRDDQS